MAIFWRLPCGDSLPGCSGKEGGFSQQKAPWYGVERAQDWESGSGPWRYCQFWSLGENLNMWQDLPSSPTNKRMNQLPVFPFFDGVGTGISTFILRGPSVERVNSVFIKAEKRKGEREREIRVDRPTCLWQSQPQFSFSDPSTTSKTDDGHHHFQKAQTTWR